MSFKNLNDEETKRLLPDGLILLGYRGSLAHGTYIPSNNPNSIDDKDVMGVFVSPIDHYFGLKKKEHHEAMVWEWDAVSYELRKFLGLMADANPNVLALLWMDDRNYILKTPLGQMLIDNRNTFISRKIYHSFAGYAKGQLKRMTAFKFEGYMGDKRKKLVEQFGYDCKNASHLVRLLRQGIEFMREGVLHVQRTDAPELIDIKTGKWTLEQVQAEADRLFRRAEEAYDQCQLPAEVDTEKVNGLCVEMLERYFAESHLSKPLTT